LQFVGEGREVHLLRRRILRSAVHPRPRRLLLLLLLVSYLQPVALVCLETLVCLDHVEGPGAGCVVLHLCLTLCSIHPKCQQNLLRSLSHRQFVALVRLDRVGGPGTCGVKVRWKDRTAGTVVVVVVVRTEASRG